jgi:hypothetical protein
VNLKILRNSWNSSQGYDTSTSVIATTLLMLAMHKKTQSKAFSEVEAFFASLSDPMTLQDASKLPYVEMVIKEAMRLFSAGSMLGRKTSADVQLGLRTVNCLELLELLDFRCRQAHDSVRHDGDSERFQGAQEPKVLGHRRGFFHS